MTTDTTALEYILAASFGNEWSALSTDDRSLIVRDCLEADGDLDPIFRAVDDHDIREYRHNIGAGNLASYARVMRCRFNSGR